MSSGHNLLGIIKYIDLIGGIESMQDRLRTSGYLITLSIVIWLCVHVWRQEAFSFDNSLLLWIHQFANPQLDRVMLFITSLGDPPMLVTLFTVTVARLALMRRYIDALRLTIAGIGGVVINDSMKLWFAKPRPELWPRLIIDTSFSFPSGHALGATIVYGFIAYILAGNLPVYRHIIYGIASILIVLIGFSRLYLGVHYPTDTIAGFGVGILWLGACLQFKQHRMR